MKIIRNSAKCTRCEIELESEYRHDYKVCECAMKKARIMALISVSYPKITDKQLCDISDILGSGIMVDGGKDYLRHGVGDSYINTSIVEEDDE